MIVNASPAFLAAEAAYHRAEEALSDALAAEMYARLQQIDIPGHIARVEWHMELAWDARFGDPDLQHPEQAGLRVYAWDAEQFDYESTPIPWQQLPEALQQFASDLWAIVPISFAFAAITIRAGQPLPPLPTTMKG